jgi:hypothetical protein
MLAAITTAPHGNESENGLRGKVAFRPVPAPLVEKRTIARTKGVSSQCVSVVAHDSVTQKPPRLVISWRQRNS